MNQTNKPSVLFLIPDQFGYSAGYYYYCKYLIEAGYRVGMICGDAGNKRIELGGDFRAHYVLFRNAFQFRKDLYNTLKKYRKDYDTIIMKQMPGLSLFALLVKRNRRFLDIRTGSVHDGAIRKWIENLDLKLMAKFFNKVFILSKELASEFHFSPTKCIWLPLGADEIARQEKNYIERMNLLYVGTFDHRRIEQAVEGFALFKRKYGEIIDCSFDLIGSGSDEAVNKVKEVVIEHNLQSDVILHGYMLHQEATFYFEKCNIGVSYIPMIPCFENQPPTKTYEYVLSGLVCIGTATGSNKQLITEDNGVLHNDTPEDFCKALAGYYENRYRYRTNTVKHSLKEYSWKNITNKILIPSISR